MKHTEFNLLFETKWVSLRHLVAVLLVPLDHALQVAVVGDFNAGGVRGGEVKLAESHRRRSLDALILES